jgi:DNA polymerase-3 subunit gamma/tau
MAVSPAAPQPPAPLPQAAAAALAQPRPTVPPGAPPGQLLPVVEPQRDRTAPPAASRAPAPVVGVPVRVQPEPRDAAMPADVVTTEEGDFWFDLVRSLAAAEAITALVRELALQSQLVARDEGQWMLRVERESINQPAARERLRTALRNAGHDVELVIEVGAVADSPSRRLAQAARERQREAEQIIQDDPFVQQMMRDFGARIVPGSIKPIQNT